MVTPPSLNSTSTLLLMITALGVVVAEAQIAIAQDRTYMDGFNPRMGILFEAPEPGGLHKAISPNGRIRAETEYGQIRVLSVDDNELLHTFSTSGGSYSPSFTPDETSLVVSVCRGNLGCVSTLYSWDLKTGKRTRIGECSGLVLDMAFDAQGDRLAVATWYGPIGPVALYQKYKKWYGGEIVVFNTKARNADVRIFCELSGIPNLNKDRAKDRDPKEAVAELYRRLDDANRRCLPVRVGLTFDGAKIVAVTATGVMRVFDARSGKPDLVVSSDGRGGSEIIHSVDTTFGRETDSLAQPHEKEVPAESHD